MLKVLEINKQSFITLTWVYNDLQTNWVWHTAKHGGDESDNSSDLFAWTQHVAEPKNVKYDTLLDSSVGVSKKTRKPIKPRKPEKNNRKNRTEKKNRLNRLNFWKNQPVRFCFGFINKKLKKPNRTETDKKPEKTEPNRKKPNQNQENRAKIRKTEPNRF